MNQDKRISVFKSISFRVPLLIMVVLLIGVGVTSVCYLRTQYIWIIESKEREIKNRSQILYRFIKNSMLATEASISVKLFSDLMSSQSLEDIKLFRTDGTIAFSDNETLDTVNSNLHYEEFTPKSDFVPLEITKNADFIKAVREKNEITIRKFEEQDRRIIVYKPLFNQPRCSQCHGVDHTLRGILRIASPMNREFQKTAQNILVFIIFYGSAIVILTTAIIIFLRRSIIIRVFSIGNVVEKVGEGNLDIKVDLSNLDEIGVLGIRINEMIDGLRERFKLTRFSSPSTLDQMRKDEEIKLGGEKKMLTVLFSDIRGFTTYSETREPEEVMAMLNDIMNMQAGIVQEFGGAVDKFVGDELMAIFEGDDMVIRAAKAAEKIRDTVIESSYYNEVPMSVGIGINTGEMISGNMGSIERIDRTVIGDSVNLGARLVSVAGKNTIILSEFSYKYIEDRVEVRAHNPIKVRGKEQPVIIYTLRRTL